MNQEFPTAGNSREWVGNAQEVVSIILDGLVQAPDPGFWPNAQVCFLLFDRSSVAERPQKHRQPTDLGEYFSKIYTFTMFWPLQKKLWPWKLYCVHSLGHIAEIPEQIIIFIDDLDRCPPDRIISMIDALMLLLSNPNFPCLSYITIDPKILIKNKLNQKNL